MSHVFVSMEPFWELRRQRKYNLTRNVFNTDKRHVYWHSDTEVVNESEKIGLSR